MVDHYLLLQQFIIGRLFLLNLDFLFAYLLILLRTFIIPIIYNLLFLLNLLIHRLIQHLPQLLLGHQSILHLLLLLLLPLIYLILPSLPSLARHLLMQLILLILLKLLTQANTHQMICNFNRQRPLWIIYVRKMTIL